MEFKESQLLFRVTNFDQIISKNYKAAGILLYSDSQALLIEEKRNNKYVWNAFGGKREKTDQGPLATATREFLEETGGICGVPSIHKSTPRIWSNESKYILYLVRSGFMPNVVTDFHVYRDENQNEGRRLCWIDTNEMLKGSTIPLARFFQKMLQVDGVKKYFKSCYRFSR
jgi:8-oxo-dGTP pyrophosphatase MutT (NUDIX family)